jgi:hypothetical protein
LFWLGLTHGCPVNRPNTKRFVITGLEPVTQPARVHATEWLSAQEIEKSLRLADASRLGGRVEPGQDEFF